MEHMDTITITNPNKMTGFKGTIGSNSINGCDEMVAFYETIEAESL